MQIDDTGRECTVCHAYKSWDRFYKQVNGAHGRASQCSECRLMASKVKRAEATSLRPTLRVDDEGRACSDCGEYLPWEAYGKSKRGARGHTSDCKACRNTKYKAWRDENVELARSLSLNWVNANKETVRATAREFAKAKRERLGLEEYSRQEKQYRINNPEKSLARVKAHYAKNRERLTAKNKLDRANRPEAHAAYDATKRAKRVKGFCPWADQAAIQAIYKLAKALSKASGLKYHVDHIVPLVNKKVQGLHVESNLRITCANDNLLKSNKFDPDTFDPNDVPSVHWADMNEADPDDLHGKVTALIERAMSNQTSLPQIEEVKSPATA